MSLVEGKLSSTGCVGGTYLGWITEYIPVQVSLLPQLPTVDVQQLFEDPIGQQLEGWRARMTVLDTDAPASYVFSDLESLSVNRNSENQQDQFSVVIRDASVAAPRCATYPAVLDAGNPARIVQLDLLLNAGGNELEFTIFRGHPTSVKADYGKARSSVAVQGTDLAELLRLADGTVEDYVGSRANLILTLLARAGITEAYLAIDDVAISPAQSFIGLTVQDVLTRLFESIPEVDYFVDHLGVFQARYQHPTTIGTWTYDTKRNIDELADQQSSQAINTVVNVTGATADASLTYEDAGLITRYGRRPGSISSNILQTAAEATAAAQAHIARTLRDAKTISIKATCINPLLNPGDGVVVTDYTEDGGGRGSNISALLMTVRSTALQWSRRSPGGQFNFGGDTEDGF